MTSIINEFGISICSLDRKGFKRLAEESLMSGRQIVQNGVNAAVINDILDNPAFRTLLSKSDVINIDGMSVFWALRFLGHAVHERVACPDFAEDLLNIAKDNKYGVFLFGATQESVIRSSQYLLSAYPGLVISGIRNGFFSDDEIPRIVDEINMSGATILLLGMPSPRKEKFAIEFRERLGVRYIFGVGGLFDIWSGITKRAPLWMQRTGLEWFFRFIQEPGRMWKRYMYGNTRFIYAVIRQKQLQRNRKPDRQLH